MNSIDKTSRGNYLRSISLLIWAIAALFVLAALCAGWLALSGNAGGGGALAPVATLSRSAWDSSRCGPRYPLHSA